MLQSATSFQLGFSKRRVSIRKAKRVITQVFLAAEQHGHVCSWRQGKFSLTALNLRKTESEKGGRSV